MWLQVFSLLVPRHMNSTIIVYICKPRILNKVGNVVLEFLAFSTFYLWDFSTSQYLINLHCIWSQGRVFATFCSLSEAKQ